MKPTTAALFIGLLLTLPGASAQGADAPWRKLTDLPAIEETVGVLIAGPGLVAFASHGSIQQFTGGAAWTTFDQKALPILDPEPGTSLRGGFVRGPKAAWYFGTRQTILRWDGAGWRVEHGDGPRRWRGHYRVIDCKGEIHATDNTWYMRRADDGTWTYLKGRKDACRLDPFIPSPENCWRHSHGRQSRIAQCRAGFMIWDAHARVWRPAPVQGSKTDTSHDPYIRYQVSHFDRSEGMTRWQHGERLLVAADDRVHAWTGDGWRVVFEAAEPIEALFGDVVPHVLVGRTLWRP